jgi:tetratricopeptide (TPR) repeat protein
MVRIKDLKVKLDSEEKREVYKRIQRQPANRDYYARLSRICIRDKNLEDAERVLRFGLRACPSDRHLQELLAQVYIDMGKRARAVDHLKYLIRKFPEESWTSYMRLARLYREQGELEKSVEVFESIAPDNPLRERSHDYLYTLFFIMQDHDRGIENLKEASRRFGVNHRRTKDLGRLYMKKGNKKQAIKWLKKALEFDPDDLDARILIGLAYLDAGEYANARRTFHKVLQLKRGSYPALINLAELDLLQGRLEEAKKILMRIHRRDPFDSRHKLGLGEYWLGKGRPKKAIPFAEKGLSETPFYYPLELVRAHDILQRAYAAQGDTSRASVHEEIRKRLSKGADPFNVMLGLAKEYRKAGESELAGEVLNQLLTTFPGNALALVEMAQAQFARGMAEKAIDLCARALEDTEGRFIKDRIEALKLMARIYRDMKKPELARRQEKLAAELKKTVKKQVK